MSALMQSTWIDLGAADEIPRLRAKKFCLGVETVAVFRTSADEFFAVIDRCPHRGGPLSEGIVSGRTVACPLHGWVIALDSGQAMAPDEGCAPILPLRLVEGRLQLGLGQDGGSCHEPTLVS
jgi:nitrite reductase (NADH) small subunit